jgi:membrane fusion protein, multidrug efflux system
VGTRVIARVSAGRETVKGVRVPNEAVVWHAGKSWAYLRQDGETFARYEVSATRDLGDGWFNRAADLVPGREIVVSGAQLLLSEELKFQIRNENED